MEPLVCRPSAPIAAEEWLAMPGLHQVDNLQRRSVKLVIDATLDDIEMQVTFAELGILMTIASLILKKVNAKAGLWDDFQTLLVRHGNLARANTTVAMNRRNKRRGDVNIEVKSSRLTSAFRKLQR